MCHVFKTSYASAKLSIWNINFSEFIRLYDKNDCSTQEYNFVCVYTTKNFLNNRNYFFDELFCASSGLFIFDVFDLSLH